MCFMVLQQLVTAFREVVLNQIEKEISLLILVAQTFYYQAAYLIRFMHAWPNCVHRVYKVFMSSDRRQWSGFCEG